MRKTFLIAALAAALNTAAPVRADVADDYTAAAIWHAAPDHLPDLTGLEGDWIAMSDLLGPGPADSSVVRDMIAQFCGKATPAGRRIDATSPFSFTITETAKSGVLTTEFNWAGGRSFQLGVDIAALAVRLGLDKMDAEKQAPIRADLAQRLLTPAYVVQLAPDVLVVTQGDRSDMFTRCPATL